MEIPIEIGSVGEARDAMREYRWSDVVSSGGPGSATPDQRETLTLAHGTAFSAESGWRIPPPSYADACDQPPAGEGPGMDMVTKVKVEHEAM